MKKKITFIINSLNVGGTEKHLLELIRFLKKYYVINIFCFKDGKLRTLFEEQKISLNFPKNNIFSIFYFINFLFNNKTDLYHFFLPKSYILGGIFTIFSKKKKVMSRRSLNYYHEKYINLSLYIEKFLHKRMDLILTNSSLAKKQLINDENVDQNKIMLIKNFFRPKTKNKSTFEMFNIKKSDVVFAIIANLIPYKGHIDLIQSCAKIDHDKWKLLIIGEDRNNYKDILEREIKNYKLENKIFFTGFIYNVSDYLLGIDFIVNVSSEEGSSNSLLEGLASGLPIIAYDIESNKEFVEDKKNGFLVSYGDKKQLTFYLKKLILSNKRKKMGIYSQNIFYRNFDRKKSENMYIKVYNSLI